MTTDREKIYDIEPTSTLEKVMEEHKNTPEFPLYHIQIEGGGEAFYDKYGGAVLSDVVVVTRLNLSVDPKIHLHEITSRFGDIYVTAEEKPVLDSAKAEKENGEFLEVKLTVSEVE